MHEFSICESIVRAVLEELQRHGGPDRVRLVSARIVVGRLRQIVPETLRFAYEVFTRETAAAGSALEIRTVPATAECRACGWKGEISGAAFVCESCGGVDLDARGGTELHLESLEVVEA